MATRARKPRKAAKRTAAKTAQAGPAAFRPRLRDIHEFSFGRDEDVAAFLRAAVQADPSTRQGKAALRAAEAAAVRIARDLRRRAREQGGALGQELERRANQNLFRAVLAKQLPRIVELLRRPHPASPAAPGVIELAGVAPSKPANVEAVAGHFSATVRWEQAPGELVTAFRVTPLIAGVAQLPTIAGGTAREATIAALTPGTAYTFTVRATNLAGNSPESDPSAPVTVLGAVVPPAGGGPLDLQLPAFSSDPALLIDSAAEPLRAYISDAARISQKWRYEYLKIQAIAAAREAMNYEEHIARLMGMAVDKLGTAEEILNATLLEVVTAGQGVAGGLAEAAEAPELDSLIDPLGDTAAQSLLLPRFFAWLIEKGPLDFWIGLFEAMICDLASVVPIVGGPTNFGRTRRFIRNAFSTNLELQNDLRTMAQDIQSRLDVEIEQMVAPLRAATDKVVEGTRAAMADVFEGFDITLLMTPAEVAGQPDVPDLDPLTDLYEQLNAGVNALAEKVKARVTEALQPLLTATDGGSLFETIVITFLVLPILAFLVIALAGGPFSAALLAAAVLLAAEELLRLLVQWLAGPLLKKLGELQQKLTELVGKLQGFFALQSALVESRNPEVYLRILASELRQLRDFLPQAFLEEAAGVLQEARNVVLRAATQIGLAAEQALGAENATGFEAIHDDYATHLAQAPQLPGGTDASRLAGAALLRDFGRLEEQRLGIRDGKELEFTHRVSLLRLLGADPVQFLQQFIQRRELLVSLTERDLIDRMFPGVYRAVIKDVRVTGILGGTIPARLPGIPLSLTHLGESRTRIKRSSNPAAPPTELPTCFPATPLGFSQPVVGPARFDIEPDRPFPDDGDVIGGVSFLIRPTVDALRAHIRRALETVEIFTVLDYWRVIFFGSLGNLSFEELARIITRPFVQALTAHVPEAIERAAIRESCGLVDPASLGTAARALLASEQIDVEDLVMGGVLAPRNNNFNLRPDLSPMIRELADRLRAGFDVGIVKQAGLVAVAQEAWKQARDSFLRRVARWGDVVFEEDPDPQVRALGFVRLVRRAPAETMVFNLFPPGPATQTQAEAPVAVSDGAPFLPASTLQYRPFENRGIEGDFLLRLESLDDDAILPLPAASLVQQLSGQLTDIVLDITVRGCFDSDLAQTVRASRRQTAAGFNIGSRLPGAVGPIGLPDSLPRVEAGASELRTVRYSLRAHRDKTLQVLNAAALAQPAPVPELSALIAGKSVLRRDVPFEPLNPAVRDFTIELSGTPLANNVAALQALVGTLRVSPADLGVNPSVLTGHDIVEVARLLSIGVAVIPMPDGVRPVDESVPDPMNIRLQVTGLLGNVFPGFATAAPLPQRLKMTIPASADPPALADLFAAAAPPSLTFNLDGALATTSLLYDVIVSLTFRVPVIQVRTVISGLR